MKTTASEMKRFDRTAKKFEAAIAALAAGDMDQHAVAVKLADRIDDFLWIGEITGDDAARTRVSAYAASTRTARIAAREAGESMNRAARDGELDRINARIRDAAPCAGTYEHELAMMRG